MNNLKNSVQLIGNLGRDVDLKEISNGSKVAKFTLATNDYYKNSQLNISFTDNVKLTENSKNTIAIEVEDSQLKTLQSLKLSISGKCSN